MSQKEVERRRVIAENARLVYEIIKGTQLVLDVLGWRTSDKRLQSDEYELSGIALDDARVMFEREKKFKILKKCITKLSEAIQAYVPEKPQPVIGLLPNGRRKPIATRYGLEGEPVEDLIPDPDQEMDDPLEGIDSDELQLLFLLSDYSKVQIEQAALEAWENPKDCQVWKCCLVIRAHAFAGTLPNLSDSKKQQILNDMQKLKDNNDWTLDPKHVYKRAILRTKTPSWAESTERMEEHHRPIWNPQARREWREPKEGDY
jgi:hypothetical protein